MCPNICVRSKKSNMLALQHSYQYKWFNSCQCLDISKPSIWTVKVLHFNELKEYTPCKHKTSTKRYIEIQVFFTVKKKQHRMVSKEKEKVKHFLPRDWGVHVCLWRKICHFTTEPPKTKANILLLNYLNISNLFS